MLILPIKKKWFDMIKSGEKKEEYREIKKYYNTRLLHYFRNETGLGDVYKNVTFKNGYSKHAPTITCRCTLNVGYGKQEWGAEKDKFYYILNIIEVMNNE